MNGNDETAPDAQTTGPVIHSFDQPPLTIPEALELAWQHYAAGRLPQSASLYRQIIQADSNQPVALHLLGLIEHQTGNGEAAVDLIRKAVTLQPKYAEAHHNLGIVLLRLNRLDEAAVSFQDASIAQPDYVEAYINMANILKDQGNMEAALEQYHKAIKIKPDHARAHYSLGLAFQDAGELETALVNYRKAISLNPGYFEALNNIGNAYRSLGRLNEAADSYRKVLEIKPEIADIHSNLGNILVDMKQFDLAIESFQIAVTIRPNFAQAHYGIGNALKELGKKDEAMARFYKAVTIDPEFAQAHYSLGGLHHAAGELDEAILAYRKAVDLNPGLYNTHNDMGVAYLDLGRAEEAKSCFVRALEINGDFALAHNNLGNALKALEQPDEAIVSYQLALEHMPIYPDALNNLGCVYKDRGQPKEAAEYFQKALDFEPNHIEALNHMGLVQLTLGDAQAAIASHKKAVELRPDNPLSYWGLCNSLLVAEEFSRAWELYDYRWKANSETTLKWRSYPQPVWDGSNLSGKRLLVWGEQGIGDEILFASLLFELSDMADSVVVECLERLAPLFERSFPDIEFVVRQDPPLEILNSPDIDFQIAAGALGRYLRQDKQSFPSRAKYLVPDPEKQASIRAGYRDQWGKKPLIGVAWHSGNTSAGKARSLLLDQLPPLLSGPDFQLINLQYGDVKDDLSALKDSTGLDVFCDPEVDPLVDIDTFCAQVAALDLVITIDNSTAHVAGALGVTTWVLLPFDSNWYWSRSQDVSLWYPSTRLYRQKAYGEWDGVIEQVNSDLNRQVLDGFNTDR